MQAVVIHAARDLRIEGADTPAPGLHDMAIRIRAGGICGSDLHHCRDGGSGTVRLRDSMVLGHEVAGTVAEAGPP